MEIFDLPAAHGSYVLYLCVARSQTIVMGRLGQQHLPLGHYFYVGSARGPGGLRARVGRHLRGAARPHWHIDYLRPVAQVRNVLYTVTDNSVECVWNQALIQLPQAFVPVPDFGASDCRSGCRAHLIAFPRRVDIASVQLALKAITPTPIDFLAPLVH